MIVPLQKLLTSLPMPPKHLVNPHYPLKDISPLIEFLRKCPIPRDNQIRITRLLAQHVRAFLMLVQNRRNLANRRQSRLPRRLSSLLAPRELLKRHPKPHSARPLEVLRARRVEQQFWNSWDADWRQRATNIEDGFLHALDIAAVQLERGLGMEGFEGVGNVARVHDIGAVGQLGHWAGVAAGGVGRCGGDAELFEFGAHVGVLDPGGFVGDGFEVERGAGWSDSISEVLSSKL